MLHRRSFLGGLAAPAIIGRAAFAEPCGEEERRKLLKFGLISDAYACGGGGGGTGPAASGAWTSDFTSLTGRTVQPQLFGMATGGLANDGGISQSGGNGNWCDVAAFPALRARVKALNLPLIRVNSVWQAGKDTFDGPFMLDNLLNNITNLWSPSTVVIYGIQCGTLTNAAFRNFTQAFCQYWKDHAPAGYKISYVECMNEMDGVAGNTYASCFDGMVTGAQLVDSTIKGTGPASAGYVNGPFQAQAVVNQYNATTGPQKVGGFNHHQYMYCPSCGDSTPSDQTVMLSLPGPNDIGSVIQSVSGIFTGTWASSLPWYGLYETNIIAGGPGENRTQTNLGAGFMASTLLKAAQQTTWTNPWFGFWDIYYDTDSDYNMIFPNLSFTVGAQYYTLQNLIRCMPGSMVATTSNNGNILVWGTKSNANFGMTLVNGNGSSSTGNVGLSHWPVNSTGNGTVTMWQLDASNYTTGGVTTHPVASAGVLSNVTLTPMSVTMISSP